jgi:hypothetical protein
MSKFFEGFEKQALLPRVLEDATSALAANVVPVQPLRWAGTGAHTAFAGRPEGHSRLGEFVVKNLMQGSGSLGAQFLAKKFRVSNLARARMMALGRAAGGVAGSRMTTGKYYR